MDFFIFRKTQTIDKESDQLKKKTGLGYLRVVELRVAVARCEVRVAVASCSSELPKLENENF